MASSSSSNEPRPRNALNLSGMLANRTGNTPIPPSLQAKMSAMLNRSPSADQQQQSQPPPQPALLHQPQSFPPRTRGRGVPIPQGRMNRPKPGFKLSDISTDVSGGGPAAAGLGAGRPSLAEESRRFDTPFANFGRIVDPSGRLNFAGKAVLHASGVDFSNGKSYAINMEQLSLQNELGRGNYGTVKKVLHRPTNVEMAMKEIRLELDSSKLNGILMELDILHRAISPYIVEFYGAFFVESCVYYCMEHMDGGSLASLCCFPAGGNVNLTSEHSPPNSSSSSTSASRTRNPARPTEPVLARIASSMTRGLAFLKDHLGVMHRDVKPTNVLVNTKGEVKLCDFGVSGQLEKSIARTNVGCQSYMAPERIKGSSASPPNADDTFTSYTVSADIWSLGLSIVEIAKGRYPYPPETYENVFAQLSAIVEGEAPGLPEDGDEEVDGPIIGGGQASGSPQDGREGSPMVIIEENGVVDESGDGTGTGTGNGPGKGKKSRWTPDAKDWVRRCLVKNASERATYPELLDHPWLLADMDREVDMVGWVARAMEWRDRGRKAGE
ncbi:kinase-like protein [Leucogyrophana mollusca]|uniref:Kinase-like protein n=1 Tax=Leucogyrophana mollusca TaxID=85980 RepID=A0ACB8B248_9AGAM|nr:kinase-like protein [Leucogyrophana mollusca]